MILIDKIKHGWGYTVGAEPPNVVLQATGKDGELSIAHWPDANPPTIEEIEAVELPPPAPPTEVTPAQIRLWLIANYGAGILSQIDGMLNAIPDDVARATAKTRWEFGLVVLRTDPLLVQFGVALGLTEAQIDEAFGQASEIR